MPPARVERPSARVRPGPSAPTPAAVKADIHGGVRLADLQDQGVRGHERAGPGVQRPGPEASTCAPGSQLTATWLIAALCVVALAAFWMLSRRATGAEPRAADGPDDR
jgi:hypothetical protein